MLPGSRVEEARNLLLLDHSSSAPALAMPGTHHHQEISTKGFLCCPCCPERSAIIFLLLFSQKRRCVLEKCALFEVLSTLIFATAGAATNEMENKFVPSTEHDYS